jgi:hypothetical protein
MGQYLLLHIMLALCGSLFRVEEEEIRSQRCLIEKMLVGVNVALDDQLK